MESKELMIGNLLQEGSEVLRVGNIYLDKGFDFAYSSGCRFVDFRDVKPIVLTKELLLYLGAKKSYNEDEIHFDRFRLIFKESYKYWYVVSLHEQAYLTKIEFVHEWQNFIFIMNGFELNTDIVFNKTL